MLVWAVLSLPLFPAADSRPAFAAESRTYNPRAYCISGTLGISASSAVLICSDGTVLYSQSDGVRMGCASTTKLMTALVACDLLDPDTTVTVPKEACGIEGSSIYLTEGERLTVRELLLGLMLESGNDCAAALAYAACGSIEAFTDEMNAKAEAIGLGDTHFVNPHGLPDENHYTTAYDLALITAEAIKIPLIRDTISTQRAYIPYRGIERGRLLINHNRLLGSYDGMIGGKTGFTRADGRCLATAAERNGLTLIAVTLSAPNDWQDHRILLDYGFSGFAAVTLAADGEYSFSLPVAGTEKTVRVSCGELTVCLPSGTVAETAVSLPRFLYAPVCAGDIVGQVVFTAGGNEYAVPLRAEYGVDAPRRSLINRLFGG